MPTPPTRLDRLPTALVAVVLLYATLTSVWEAAHRPFWFDEVFTVVLTEMPSFRQVVAALRDAADTSGPGYYVVQHLFGRLALDPHVSYRLSSVFATSLICYETGKADVNELLDMCNAPPIVAMVNTYKYVFLGYIPFILSIRNTDAFMAFLRGELIITVAVDPSVISQRFRNSGFDIEFKDDEKWAIRLTCAKHEDFNMMAGRHFFDRLFTEFLSLDWFMNELIHRATRNIKSKGQT